MRALAALPVVFCLDWWVVSGPKSRAILRLVVERRGAKIDFPRGFRIFGIVTNLRRVCMLYGCTSFWADPAKERARNPVRGTPHTNATTSSPDPRGFFVAKFKPNTA